MNWQKLYAQTGLLVASFCSLGDDSQAYQSPHPALRSGFCLGPGLRMHSRPSI